MIRVESGSRLHFGLLSFGQRRQDTAKRVPTEAQQEMPGAWEPNRAFGGIGLMVDQPRLRLELAKASSDQVACGADRQLEVRLQHLLARWRQSLQQRGASSDHPAPTTAPWEQAASSGVRLQLLEAPPAHCGFGSGTQLGLALAAGLSHLFRLPAGDSTTWATWIGRGRRSAVGTHGFAEGGLIVDRGKLSCETVAPLASRLSFPSSWRFVIACNLSDSGLSGTSEQAAFSRLPAVPESHSRQMFAELHEELLPAVAAEDFDRFAKSLWRYGNLAGDCFASAQGGSRFSPPAQPWVDFARKAGFTGVGQSSWGPAVFIATPDDRSAHELVIKMKRAAVNANSRFWIAQARNTGAEVSSVQMH